jgi:hypothetical protein
MRPNVQASFRIARHSGGAPSSTMVRSADGRCADARLGAARRAVRVVPPCPVHRDGSWVGVPALRAFSW